MIDRDRNFKVGDGVSWGAGTDQEAGTVVAVTPATVTVVEDRSELLNGFDSGADDALKADPGGYSAFVHGRQRYSFSPGSGRRIRFSLRRRINRFKMAGTSINGSMSGWGILSHGRSKHYDYNF